MKSFIRATVGNAQNIKGHDMKCSFIAAAILATQIFAASAQNVKGILEELPKKDKYGYIKKNSLAENLSVFNQYEAQKSDKVIFICIPNFISFRLEAYWDLDEIRNKADAEKFAAKECAASSSGYVLLGYSIRSEFKF